ncbi:MAG: M50 family metallopeptidase [Pyrinomonadaceae bacterium]
MRYKLADDARPQVKFLLIATVITIALWFIPYADYLVYPVRLFVTFVHEGSHVLAALLTGGTVESLTVASNGSGEVYSVPSGFFGAILTSSAGYLGATAFGVLLLVMIRRAISARIVLTASAIFVGAMTVLFGLLAPFWNLLPANTTIGGIAFTVISGAILTAGLLAIARYAKPRVTQFVLSFLAVQCVLNALSDLKTVFFLSSPFNNPMQTDAANMASATGIPAIAWVVIWIGISILMISIGLRVYAVSKSRANHDLPFQD